MRKAEMFTASSTNTFNNFVNEFTPPEMILSEISIPVARCLKAQLEANRQVSQDSNLLSFLRETNSQLNAVSFWTAIQDADQIITQPEEAKLDIRNIPLTSPAVYPSGWVRITARYSKQGQCQIWSAADVTNYLKTIKGYQNVLNSPDTLIRDIFVKN